MLNYWPTININCSSFHPQISEGVDYTCGKYKSLDDCSTHLDGKVWQKMLEIGKDPSTIGFKPKFKSPITPSLRLFNGIQ